MPDFFPDTDTWLAAYIARLDRRIAALEERSRRFSGVRLSLVIGGAAVAFGLGQMVSEVVGWWTALAVVVAFAVVVRLHNRLAAGIERFRRWQQIKATHRARLALDWPTLPPAEPTADDRDHPFALDLNLAGTRSLQHLLNTTVTRGGSARLRAWLTEPVPDLSAARTQQTLVRSLVPAGRFRDKLALYGRLTAGGGRWDDAGLHRWLDRPDAADRLRPWVIGLSALAATNVVLVLLHILGLAPALWSVTLVAYIGLYLSRFQTYSDLFDDALDLEMDIERIRPALRLLETSRWPRRPQLAAFLAPLQTGESRPSQHLKQIHRIAAAASMTRSEFLAVVFNLLLPWNLLFTYLLHRETNRLRNHLPRWLDRWYDLEALCALARFADQHPGTSFPDLLDATETPVFDGRALGHPLIPLEARVRNDFRMEHFGEIALITGSNMSGKSTFLRTVGMNLCLAYAGGPVDADALRVVPFRLFSSLNVQDSVQDGLSFFYAEVRRLKALLDALRADHPVPLFFLIDEIFRGTNNRERRIGSQAYVRALAQAGGTGLITTHDLELTALANEITTLRNLHFREDVEEDRMVFDYRLRPGPCPTTNALKIMHLEGLPIETEAIAEDR